MLFDSVYVVALTAWIGSILFFTFGVAPIIFRVLGAEAGGRFVRALFPRYYFWGALWGSVALPAFVAGPLCYPPLRGIMAGVQALAILGCTLIMLHGGHSLVPAINHARDAGPTSQERFRRLHRRSVWLNGVVLAVGLLLLVGFAIRGVPASGGIVELSPRQRARYDAAVGRVIEDVEARHGLRSPRTRRPGESGEPEMVLDQETVNEIESYYAPWKGRDATRRPAGQRWQGPASPGSESPRSGASGVR
jgi:hypothetical protein